MSIFDGGFSGRVSAFEKRVPKLIEKIAEEWYKDNFDKGGWKTSNITVDVWEKRTRSYKHPILKKTGKLKNSIKANFGRYSIEITEGTTYGKYHNRGNPATNLPRRKFLGDSESLSVKIQDTIAKELQKIL